MNRILLSVHKMIQLAVHHLEVLGNNSFVFFFYFDCVGDFGLHQLAQRPTFVISNQRKFLLKVQRLSHCLISFEILVNFLLILFKAVYCTVIFLALRDWNFFALSGLLALVILFGLSEELGDIGPQPAQLFLFSRLSLLLFKLSL